MTTHWYMGRNPVIAPSIVAQPASKATSANVTTPRKLTEYRPAIVAIPASFPSFIQEFVGLPPANSSYLKPLRPSRFDEPQNELVVRHLRSGDRHVARVVGIAQEIRDANELE